MVFHVHVENYTVESVGARVNCVRCEHCRTDYEYRTVRSAIATTSAVYGVGGTYAHRKAGEHAQRAMEKRLAKTVDLLPYRMYGKEFDASTESCCCPI